MIKTLAHAVIKSVSRLAPAGILRRAARKNLLTFCYHVVSNYSIPHIKYYAYKNRAQFEADIIYLKKNFTIASYDDFIHAARSGSQPKEKLALVTIDDGLAQCFTDIRPILLRHKVPGVFFIATDYIDNTRLLPEQKASLCIDILQRAPARKLTLQLHSLGAAARVKFRKPLDAIRYLMAFDALRDPVIDSFCHILGRDPGAYARQVKPFLSTQQIRQLAADGFTIGAHTDTHTRLDLLETRRIRQEIIGSCATIIGLTGAKHLPFAFPHHGRFVDRELIAAIMRECPYIDLIFDSRWLRKERPFILNRVWADQPPRPGTTRSNLPRILKYAYTDALISRIRSRAA